MIKSTVRTYHKTGLSNSSGVMGQTDSGPEILNTLLILTSVDSLNMLAAGAMRSIARRDGSPNLTNQIL